MSRVNATNVGLGLGILEIGSYSGEPSNPVFLSYRNAGAIKATANVTWTRTILAFTTGRPLQVIKQEVTEEQVTAQFTLAEITVANLKDALGGGTNSSSVIPTFVDGTSIAPAGDLTDSNVALSIADDFLFGGQCDVQFVALRFTNLKSCSTGLRRIFEMFKASPEGNLALPFNETDWNQYQVTWRAIADLTRPAGQQLAQFIVERG